MMALRINLWRFLLAVAAAILLFEAAYSQAGVPLMRLVDAVDEDPSIVLADTISGTLSPRQLTFLGNVRTKYQELNLRAGRLIIDEGEGTLDGGVKIRATNSTLIAEAITIDRTTQHISASNGALTDGLAYLTFASAQQDPDGSAVFNDAAYSYCPDCSELVEQPWAIHATSIKSHPDTQQVKLDRVQLDVAGFPILSVPSWQVANPEASRLAGFAQPDISFENGMPKLGLSRFQPLNTNQDLKSSILLDGATLTHIQNQFRHATPTQRLEIISRIDPVKAHGDIEISGDFFLGPHSRLRSEGRWESNQGFGDRQGHDSSSFRRTNLTWERFKSGDYARLEISRDFAKNSALFSQHQIPYRYSGLFESEPRVLPSGHLSSRSLHLDITQRPVGRGSVRLVARGEISSPQTLWHGQLWQVSANSNIGLSEGTGIDTTSDEIAPENPNFSGQESYANLGLSLDGRYPLEGYVSGIKATLSPRMKLSTAGGTSPTGKTANEDALAVSLGTGSLFRSLAAGPLDRNFLGNRIDIGAEAILDQNQWTSHILAGYRFEQTTNSTDSIIAEAWKGSDALLFDAGLRHQTSRFDARFMSITPQNKNYRGSQLLDLTWPISSWEQSFALADLAETTSVAGGQEWSTALSGSLTTSWTAELGLSGKPGELNKWSTSLTGPISTSWLGSFSLSDEPLVENQASLKTKIQFKDCCFALSIFADYDENNGSPEGTLGFRFQILGLGGVPRRNLLSF
ncbi:MAG: hypothetical protein ACPGRH_03475 [Alphaproteobacteria bacterium]